MLNSALTVSRLMAQEDLFRNILELQPAIIAINIGVTDMMIENISWEKIRYLRCMWIRYMSLCVFYTHI